MSLHDSLRGMHSPPLSGHIDNSHIVTDNSTQTDEHRTGASDLSISSQDEYYSSNSQSLQQSCSLFTTSYRYAL